MQDEQYKEGAGKLTYVHSVKLLRNAGDLPSVQTGHRRGAECQEQERQGNKSEEDSENMTQLQRRQHTGIWKSHYILLLSKCILKYGCNSAKFHSATDNVSVKVTYQYNGCTKQNKHDQYRISNILFFFILKPLYFYRHLFCSGPSTKEKIFIEYISNYAQ
jgi:hypothetical protein